MMTILGAFAAAVFAIVVPLWYYVISMSELRDSLQIESFFVAKAIEKNIQARADMWEFETVRLKELISQPTHDGKKRERKILGLTGNIIVKTDYEALHPVISASQPFYDSGRQAGAIKSNHSIRSLILFTTLLGLFSSLLGFISFYLFRTYPVRKLDQALADLQKAEEEQRRHRDIAEKLAGETAIIAEIGRLIGSTIEIDEVYERFAVEAGKLIHFDRLAINLCRLHENRLTVAYVFGADIPLRNYGDSTEMEGTLSEAVMHGRTSMLIQPDNNVESIAKIVRQIPELAMTFQVGLRSLLSVPLIYRDEAVGVLHFRTTRQNAYTERDIHLAERIGRQIAGAITNARLFAELRKTDIALRESEVRYRALVERAAVGVAEISMKTGRFLTVNQRLCEILGRAEEEMLQTTFPSITHPEDSHLHKEKAALLLAGKIGQYDLEKRYLHKDGRTVWVDIKVSPLWKPGETAVSCMTVVLDITQRKQLELESAHRSRQMTALHKMSTELAAELDIGSLFRFIAQRALDLVGGTNCHCYLYRPESDLMERVASAGPELTLAYESRIRRRGEGFVGHVWEADAPLLVNDYRAWPGRKKEYDSLSSRALVGAPIRWGKELLGIIDTMAYLPHQYNQTDLDLLGMFAVQAATAIRNARLYSRIEQISVTDELTGLFNRRGFFQLGEREFDRSLRFKRPLAVLMFDVDRFKMVNDVHGHPAGDQVLRAIAENIRQDKRAIDIDCRYGGEEFVILLPETLLPGAIHLAERLRVSIAERVISIYPKNDHFSAVDIHITVSIGIAVLSDDVPSLIHMLGRADHALYRAKDEGRNRVVVWEEMEKKPG
jgi:diguanylate cyclase (GGDEF)-like protein/PAS domain S-box-containing protein